MFSQGLGKERARGMNGSYSGRKCASEPRGLSRVSKEVGRLPSSSRGLRGLPALRISAVCQSTDEETGSERLYDLPKFTRIHLQSHAIILNDLFFQVND